MMTLNGKRVVERPKERPIKKVHFIFFAPIIFLLACATPTPYQQASQPGGKGYRSHKLDDSKYRISFKGNRVTEREVVETYLLYRAAEVTKESGFTHFSLQDMNTDRKTDYEVTAPAVYGFMPNPALFPYSVYGMPYGGRGARAENTEYEAVAYVRMTKRSPEEASGLEHLFNAEQVLKNLKDQLKTP